MDQEPAKLPALVVVPRHPGPLIVPPSTLPGARDEIDVELDDLFGEPLHQKPGPLDAGLVAGGVSVIAIAEGFYGGGALVWVGGVCLVLGLVLPVRSLWSVVSRKRVAERYAATLKEGDPLNLTDPSTRLLADAYMRIEQSARIGTDPLGSDALEASLQALQEVANLLRGRPPRGAAEVEYVARRATAVESLARSVGGDGTPSDADDDTVMRTRNATAEAITAFEERTGMSSLDRIESIRGGIRTSKRR
jgi:hypothetical protein